MLSPTEDAFGIKALMTALTVLQRIAEEHTHLDEHGNARSDYSGLAAQLLIKDEADQSEIVSIPALAEIETVESDIEVLLGAALRLNQAHTSLGD